MFHLFHPPRALPAWPSQSQRLRLLEVCQLDFGRQAKKIGVGPEARLLAYSFDVDSSPEACDVGGEVSSGRVCEL